MTAQWLSEGSPAEPGWYPVLLCWEPSEGFFPNGRFWDGSAWQGKDPVAAFLPIKATDGKDAQATAYRRDPEW